MDQVKIGKYIAGKRKKCGLTQVQIAEKLGMSDKSVSKWERGVCLPDVSIYTELCGILGISLHEFIAGEDIEQKDIFLKSQENLISVVTDGNKKKKKMIGIIVGLVILTLILTSVLILHFAFQGTDDRNRNVSNTDVTMFLDTDSTNPHRAIIRTFEKEEFDTFSDAKIEEIRATVKGRIEGDIPTVSADHSEIIPVFQDHNQTGITVDTAPTYKIVAYTNCSVIPSGEVPEGVAVLVWNGTSVSDGERYGIDVGKHMPLRSSEADMMGSFICCYMELTYCINEKEYVSVTAFDINGGY